MTKGTNESWVRSELSGLGNQEPAYSTPKALKLIAIMLAKLVDAIGEAEKHE